MPDDAKIAKAENYDATFADCVVQSEIWGNLQCTVVSDEKWTQNQKF